MAELTTGERLQPSLLDRLTDNEPDKTRESRDKRVMSLSEIREAVERDLAALLNASCLGISEDLSAYPEVERSVINYGVPNLVGMSAAGANTVTIERLVQEAVRTFEPRILPNSLQVRVVTNPDEMHRRAIVFEIEGNVWSQPMPMRLFWNTEIDLESGDVIVRETSG